MTRSRRTNLTFFAFLAPWLLGFVFLTVIPLVIGLWLSFTNYDGLNWDSMKLVGFGNYGRAFTDPEVGFSLRQTLVWLALYLPLWMIVSFALAFLVNQARKWKGFFRMVYFLPTIVPAASVVMVWRTVLDKNIGLLNALISFFRPGTAIGWLSDYSLQGLTVIVLWASLGTGMIILLAGLQNIPDELVEAAKIDGANGWQILGRIVLPLMTPVIFFQLILGLISVFQQLTYPLLMGYAGRVGSTGIPPRGITLYMYNAYHEIFANQRYGFGSALLWLLFIGIVILSLAIFWSQRYWVHTGETAD